ncbi:MAG: protein kinase [Cyanobacteria bacterium HKST-UBA01]|nr:protein kinase [Cyanobacteria bacterium HKST-UBA01]
MSHPDSSPGSDQLIGTTIGGHYEILSIVGVGGMGTVYKARHRLLDRYVALKVILSSLVHDEQAMLRFQQEARAAAELEHPNICSVKEFGMDENGHAFLVMDYLEGSSLEEVLSQEKNLSLDRVSLLAEQLCLALSLAHRKNVVHRDLKPSNIMLSKDENGAEIAKLVDFGIAKIIRDDQSGSNLTKTGEVFGTPTYMSPEQCKGQSIDTRADIYSLGCVLYEMISGKPLFSGNSTLDTLWMHVNEPLPNLSESGIPAGMRPIIQCCLAKSVEQRYQSIDELLKDLIAVRDGGVAETARARASEQMNVLNLRFSAWCIDSFIIGGIAALIGIVTAPSIMSCIYLAYFERLAPGMCLLFGAASKSPALAVGLVVGIIHFLYNVGFELSPLQGTIGKKKYSLVVCSKDGSKPPWWKVLFRYFLKGATSMVLLGFGILIMNLVGMLLGLNPIAWFKADLDRNLLIVMFLSIVPATTLMSYFLRERYQMLHDLMSRCIVVVAK